MRVYIEALNVSIETEHIAVSRFENYTDSETGQPKYALALFLPHSLGDDTHAYFGDTDNYIFEDMIHLVGETAFKMNEVMRHEARMNGKTI